MIAADYACIGCNERRRTRRRERKHSLEAPPRPHAGLRVVAGRRSRDPAKADALEAWLVAVHAAFGERILPIDRAVSDQWGHMSALRPLSTVDGLLAATAKVHRMVLVTRNEADVVGLLGRKY